MLPQKRDISERQGTTLRRSYQIMDSTRTPLVWTGYAARMHVRTTIDAAEPTLALTTENGGLTLADNGWIEIYVTATAMAALDVATYAYDLELIAPNDDVLSPIYGKFKIKGEVTRQ